VSYPCLRDYDRSIPGGPGSPTVSAFGASPTGSGYPLHQRGEGAGTKRWQISTKRTDRGLCC
jgi:hypothetical protein